MKQLEQLFHAIRAIPHKTYFPAVGSYLCYPT